MFFHGEHPLSTITGGLQNQLTNYSCFRPRILLLIAKHGVSQITLNWLVRSALLDILQIGFSIKAVVYDTNFIDSLTSLVMLPGIEPGISTLKRLRVSQFHYSTIINCPTNNTLVCSLTLSWYYLKWAGMWFSSLVGLESLFENLQIKISQLLPFHMPLCSGVWCCGFLPALFPSMGGKSSALC